MDIIHSKRAQSLFDLALQIYGRLGGVFDLIVQNQLNGPTDNVYAGEMLRIDTHQRNGRLHAFLAPYDIATLEAQDRSTGIGWWRIQSDFIIS